MSERSPDFLRHFTQRMGGRCDDKNRGHVVKGVKKLHQRSMEVLGWGVSVFVWTIKKNKYN